MIRLNTFWRLSPSIMLLATVLAACQGFQSVVTTACADVKDAQVILPIAAAFLGPAAPEVIAAYTLVEGGCMTEIQVAALIKELRVVVNRKKGVAPETPLLPSGR